MKISIICSSVSHPIRPRLKEWMRRNQAHQIELVEKAAQLSGGDLLLLISCGEMIGAPVRSRYRSTLVLHASDLPRGRGWSPHIWQILEGRNRFAVTLLEAADRVDTGDIWHQVWVDLEGHELYDEINVRLFDAELALMDFAVDNFGSVKPRAQSDGGASYYRRRNPDDSRLDPDRSLGEQFDLLRVTDPDRFPAFVEIRGHRYAIHLRKMP